MLDVGKSNVGSSTQIVLHKLMRLIYGPGKTDTSCLPQIVLHKLVSLIYGQCEIFYLHRKLTAKLEVFKFAISLHKKELSRIIVLFYR